MKEKRSSTTIAIVDDTESILDSVRMVLESQQWNILTYATGETFLADLERHHLDCVILDPHLTSLSGVDVAQALTKLRRPIPILVLTAYPNSPLTKEIEEMGVYCVLLKPITAEKLIGQIKTACLLH